MFVMENLMNESLLISHKYDIIAEQFLVTVDVNTFVQLNVSFLCLIAMPSFIIASLQVTPCFTVWWLSLDVALWGKSRIQRFSESHKQTLSH